MILTRTPMRLPLGGGGTDLPQYYSKYEGWLMGAGMDKYMFINVNRPVVDNLIRVKYSKSETVESVDQVQHPLVREALKLLSIPHSVEISAMADIPAGTGLGSSSCFTVGLLTALYALKKERTPTQVVAEEACTIEIDRCGKPIGKQDQYLSAFGGLTILEFDRSGHVTVRAAEIAPDVLMELQNSLMIFYTGIQRDADEVLAEQGKGVKEENPKVVESMHTIKNIGKQMYKGLQKGDVGQVGELMDVHWQTKKKVSTKISNPQIDEWYAHAKKNGALGGKIMGAGGGGFFLFYCDQNRAKLRDAMLKAGLREMFFRFDMEGSKVLADF